MEERKGWKKKKLKEEGEIQTAFRKKRHYDQHHGPRELQIQDTPRTTKGIKRTWVWVAILKRRG